MSGLTIAVVRAGACHLCDDAEGALADIAVNTPIQVELMEADTAAGMEMVGRHRPASFPLVLLVSCAENSIN